MTKEWNKRADLPEHVLTMLNNFPAHVHPMSQFAAAIASLNTESKFVQAYSGGVPKGDFWQVRCQTLSLLFWFTFALFFCFCF